MLLVLHGPLHYALTSTMMCHCEIAGLPFPLPLMTIARFRAETLFYTLKCACSFMPLLQHFPGFILIVICRYLAPKEDQTRCISASYFHSHISTDGRRLVFAGLAAAQRGRAAAISSRQHRHLQREVPVDCLGATGSQVHMQVELQHSLPYLIP